MNIQMMLFECCERWNDVIRMLEILNGRWNDVIRMLEILNERWNDVIRMLEILNGRWNDVIRILENVEWMLKRCSSNFRKCWMNVQMMLFEC